MHDADIPSSSPSPPTAPTPSSPPSYNHQHQHQSHSQRNYPRPVDHSKYPQPPVFKQRKSSTVIDIDCSTSPIKITSSLPQVTHSHLPLHQYSAESDAERLENQNTDRDHDHESLPSPAAFSSLPAHIRSNLLSRTPSNSSSVSATDNMDNASVRMAEEGESTPLLLANHDPNININDDNHECREGERDADPASTTKWYRKPLVIAAFKFAILFIAFTAIVVGTFYFCLPKMDEGDKAVLKLPRSFADLQAMNSLFQKYKQRYPLRILACGIVTYLFVQTFTLPGSMYISILFGAAYGIMYGLVLSCLCESFGSLLCYTLSAILAPPLLTMPFYRARVETWRIKIMGDPRKGKEVTWDSVFAFLIVLRIAPFPPHWIANFVAPHLGIGAFMFWASAFIGIGPVSVIHVTIGSSLDSMTSAADFHILSLRNILGLCAVVVAVLIPVGLKRVFKKDLGDLGEAEEVLGETGSREREVDVPAVGENREGRRYHAIDSGVVLSLPSRGDGSGMGNKLIKGKGRALEIIPDDDEEEEEDEYGEGSEGEGSGIGETSYQGGLGEAVDTAQVEDESGIASESAREAETTAQAQAQSSPNSPGSLSPEIDHDNRWDYQVYDSAGHFQRVEINASEFASRARANSTAKTRSRSNSKLSGSGSGARSYRSNSRVKGYGAIEEPPSEEGAPSVTGSTRPGAGARWWSFSSNR
ncbi:transmembrane protein [Kwoniella heveanensis BCC8398]|uniref:Transmembrane protein n=1 Tax=Kwoniella heveanensis BCC8398 TaxID=1296120 RepID=A0A1B9H4A4_9TREE|nr:transmembrane protein [Kwoniella heveanensis BCC8398]